MATKIIKLNNGLSGSSAITYVPVTTSEAIQHSWGDASKQQLKSYLGDLKVSLDSSIATVANAELETRKNLAATYIKAGSSADKISYNLPNGTYGLITVNDVAHAKSADTADKLGSKSIDFNSLDATISYKIGNDYIGTFEAKASNSAYGFTKVETAPTAGSTNAISSGFAKTLETKVDEKAATGHTHSLNWKTSEKTSDAGSEITALVDVPSSETQFGTSAGTAQFTTYKLPTKKYVDDAVAGAFADVASALKYKGTIGTGAVTNTHVNSLPASHDVGDVWVVSSDGNYAGKACEVGDYIVCNTKGTTANDAHWDVLNGENQVSNNGATLTIPYTTEASNATTIATVDGTNITLKTQHASVTYTSAKLNDAAPAHGGDFTVIGNVEVSNGHVTKLHTQKVTLPSETKLSKTGTDKTVTLTHGGTFTYISNLNVNNHAITYDYATATLPVQDHTKSGSISAGQLTYWNNATTHTAVTNSYGNSTSKYVYVENGVLKEGTLPEGNKAGKNIVGASSTATANANANAGSTYLNHIEDGVVKSAHKITGSGGISVTATDTGATITVVHSTDAGYKHIPTGGSANQVLKYSSAGTAVWSSLSEGLKYDIYNSTDDFTLDLGASIGTVSIAKTTF